MAFLHILFGENHQFCWSTPQSTHIFRKNFYNLHFFHWLWHQTYFWHFPFVSHNFWPYGTFLRLYRSAPQWGPLRARLMMAVSSSTPQQFQKPFVFAPTYASLFFISEFFHARDGFPQSRPPQINFSLFSNCLPKYAVGVLDLVARPNWGLGAFWPRSGHSLNSL